MREIIKQHLLLPSPLEKLESDFIKSKKIELYIKRDDLIHADISGNKWRKLKYNLLEAKKYKNNTLVSFGGSYSNHLVALAAAAKMFGFRSVGYIRGDEIDKSNKTINFLLRHDMKLIPLSRTDFRNLNNRDLIHAINQSHPNSYIVPMGGTNKLAIAGITEMMDEIHDVISKYDYICTPIGSGGTAAGIIKNTPATTLVFNSFKKDFTSDLIEPLIGPSYSWRTINDYHFGGFAKTKPELINYISDFKKEYHIPLEYVYNGKMLYGIFDMITNNKFKPGSKIVVVHTGGLQGNLYL